MRLSMRFFCASKMRVKPKCLGGIAFPYPCDQKLPYYCEHNWAKKKSGNAIGERAANDANQYHQHWRLQPPAHDDGPQKIIEQIDWYHVGREQQRGCRFHHGPAPNNNGNQNDRWTNLDDTENEDGESNQTRLRNTGHHQPDTCKQGLQNRNTNNAARHCANGCSGLIYEVFSPRRIESARKRFDCISERRRRREKESGDNYGYKELNCADARVCTDAKQAASQRFKLGQNFSHCRPEISRCKIPKLVDRIANQRPTFHGL